MGITGFVPKWVVPCGLLRTGSPQSLLAGARIAVDGTWMLNHIMRSPAVASNSPRVLADHVSRIMTGWVERAGAEYVYFIVDGPTVKPKVTYTHPERFKATSNTKARLESKLELAKAELHTARALDGGGDGDGDGAGGEDIDMDMGAVTGDTVMQEMEVRSLQAKLDIAKLYLTRQKGDIAAALTAQLLGKDFPGVCMRAPHDAEGYVGLLCTQGVATAAVAADTDTLFFGATLQIYDTCDLDNTREVNYVVRDEVEAYVREVQKEYTLPDGVHHLAPLDHLIHAAVMSGCDYCPKLGNMAWKTAWKWVCEHGDASFDAFDVKADLLPRPKKKRKKKDGEMEATYSPPRFKIPTSFMPSGDWASWTEEDVKNGLEALRDTWKWARTYFQHKMKTPHAPTRLSI